MSFPRIILFPLWNLHLLYTISAAVDCFTNLIFNCLTKCSICVHVCVSFSSPWLLLPVLGKLHDYDGCWTHNNEINRYTTYNYQTYPLMKNLKQIWGNIHITTITDHHHIGNLHSVDACYPRSYVIIPDDMKTASRNACDTKQCTQILISW